MSGQRILFCSSEVYPLIKTGGLADVAASLPQALHKTGNDIRIVLPFYRAIQTQLEHLPKRLLDTQINGQHVAVLQTRLPGTRVPVWLVDCPEYFDRPGNPYLAEDGQPWPDNAPRFALFNRVIGRLAMNQCGLNWQPDVVHCNDWQTGLVPALLHSENKRPACVFTIHNLAYQGIFDRTTFEQLQLPESLWHYEQLEYYGQFSFIKGGLVFADRINTVSPNYAQEIQTAEFGYGLQDLLQHRQQRLSGIINGIDTQVWNPGSDSLIAHKYNRQRLTQKGLNKQALQKAFNLPQQDPTLLLGMISRLAEQKGVDLLLGLLPELIQRPVQLVILGSGDKQLEAKWQKAAQEHPQQIGVRIGYDESLAHLIEAGIDAFLMPSRFEPCGLNQMYSQRYGSLPIVSPVGGLVDTVTDYTPQSLDEDRASGFVMTTVNETALLASIDRAITAYREPEIWRQLMRNAMQKDFSWQKSAEAYIQLYAQARRDNPKPVS